MASNVFLGSGNPFYYATFEKIVAMMLITFSNIKIYTNGELITVPIHYIQREKFLTAIENISDDKNMIIDSVLPKMGLDDVSMAHSAERGLGRKELIKPIIQKGEKGSNSMYNRVPYVIDFELTVATKNKEHDTRIMEQIIPSFNPTLNITINDINEFDISTDILITLSSISPAVELIGSYDNRRAFTRTYFFSVNMYFYCPTEYTNRIKQAILELTADKKKINDILIKAQYDVVPKTANKGDPHIITETITEELTNENNI